MQALMNPWSSTSLVWRSDDEAASVPDYIIVQRMQDLQDYRTVEVVVGSKKSGIVTLIRQFKVLPR